MEIFTQNTGVPIVEGRQGDALFCPFINYLKKLEKLLMTLLEKL